jgi:hypothetical protein
MNFKQPRLGNLKCGIPITRLRRQRHKRHQTCSKTFSVECNCKDNTVAIFLSGSYQGEPETGDCGIFGSLFRWLCGVADHRGVSIWNGSLRATPELDEHLYSRNRVRKGSSHVLPSLIFTGTIFSYTSPCFLTGIASVRILNSALST